MRKISKREGAASIDAFDPCRLDMDMTSAIKTVVTTFLGSAMGGESLNSQSFKNLTQKKLGSFMEDEDLKSSAKEMQQGLDKDNRKVSFPEFLDFLHLAANSWSKKKSEGNAD